MRKLKLVVVAVFAAAGGFLFLGSGDYNTVRGVVTGGGEVPAAPTGVDASDDQYGTKVGINWDTIRGATLYRIFRNTTDDSVGATELGTTAANYFFDNTAVGGQGYFYWVRAENGGLQSPLSSSDAGSRPDVPPPGQGDFAPLEAPPAPADNPVTATKAYLGKALFWDEQLSSTKTVSCGTCHRPAAGGSDPRSLFADTTSINPGPNGTFGDADDIVGSKGVPSNNSDGSYNFDSTFGQDEQVTGRLAPSYLNAMYTRQGLFWDGRALDEFRDPITDEIIVAQRGGLESQAAGPPVSGVEMGHSTRDWNEIATQILSAKPLAVATGVPTALETWINGRSYPELFEEAFGSSEVTPSKILMAIATHERTLFSDRTKHDRVLYNIDTLTPMENMGRGVYLNSSCNVCHGGPLLSNNDYHNIGVRPMADDLGRFEVTGANIDRAAFKTPILRNVELRPVYMHNGRFESLDDVVEFYDRGGDFDAPNIDRQFIRNLNLNQQQRDALVAFMRTFTDARVANELPPFDRPTLYTETDRVPEISGKGRQGTGGEVPIVTAVEPPLAGNQNFTVGISNVIPGTQAVLVVDSTDPGVGTTIPAAGSFARETITTSDDGSSNGFGSVSLEIPATSDVVGSTYFGRWYVTDATAANGFAVSQLFEFTVFGDVADTGGTRYDFTGDGKADVSVFRRSLGQWWFLRSEDNQDGAFAFGTATDTPVPADFTGDGIADFSFWRESTGEWFVLRSDNTGFFSFPFGASGDIPAPGDFDGDGTDDAAVYRPSSGTWFIQRSSDGNVDFVPFGAAVDRPLVGDYDGDGTDDVAIYKPDVAQFWQLRSTEGLRAFAFGATTDIALTADMSGDGTDDMVQFRPSTGFWNILRSEDSNFYGFPFGATGDIPAAADYDGDGTADPTVFRESDTTWYSQQSTSGSVFTPFGIAGDEPIPGAYNSQ